MSKNNMTDFQRTRSKVWFPNLDDDDEDIHHSWRRQPSSSPESRRVSSGSPSNGSHKSQDSGFSDSESSPLGLSKALPKEDKQHDNTNAFTDKLPDGVLPEATVPRVPSPCEPHPQTPNHCNCLLPACELSRKFHSFEFVTAEETTPFRQTTKRYEKEPARTPNRTCFIVDELPKTPLILSTPSSVKSFDGHFDQSENVTVVENIKQDCIKNNELLIIDPPTPFVDRLNDVDTVSLCESDRPGSPEHTSTPKSTKNRCCTPRLHYRKDLQLRKPKHLKNSFSRLVFNNKIIIQSDIRYILSSL